MSQGSPEPMRHWARAVSGHRVGPELQGSRHSEAGMSNVSVTGRGPWMWGASGGFQTQKSMQRGVKKVIQG